MPQDASNNTVRDTRGLSGFLLILYTESYAPDLCFANLTIYNFYL